MRGIDSTKPSEQDLPRDGICLTNLSVAALLGGSIAVSAVLWLCIFVVL